MENKRKVAVASAEAQTGYFKINSLRMKNRSREWDAGRQCEKKKRNRAGTHNIIGRCEKWAKEASRGIEERIVKGRGTQEKNDGRRTKVTIRGNGVRPDSP